MRVGQTSIIYFISKVIASVFGFLGTIYITRTLGEEIYGYFVITIALLSWLTVIKSVGFGQAVVKRMSEDEEQDEYLVAGTIIKILLTLVVGVGVLVFQDTVNSYIGRPVAEFVILLLIATIFSELVDTALKGTHRVHVYGPLSMLREATQSVAMIMLVYVGWELTGLLLGYTAGTILIAIIGLFIIRPQISRPSTYHFTKLFDFAKFSWLGSLRKRMFSDMDIIVLGLFVPASLTGIYAASYSLAKFLDLFGSAVQTTLFPEISKRSSADEDLMVSKLTNDALSYAGLLLIPGIIGSWVIGDLLMNIYGDGFAIGADILTILLIGILAYSYNKQLLNTLNAIDRADLAFRANLIFVITNMGLNIILVYTIGWFGAAIATAASAIFGLIFGYYYTKSQIEFAIPFHEMSLQWIGAIGMGVIVYSMRAILENNLTLVVRFGEVLAIVLVAIGSVSYFFILLLISSNLRRTIRNNLPENSLFN